MNRAVGIIGANGRMGQELARALAKHPEFSPAVGFAEEAAAPGFALTARLQDDAAYRGLQGIVDFSVPAITVAVAERVSSLKIPLVIGTTGLSEIQLAAIRECGAQAPVFWSPNMSLGVALLIRALKSVLPPADFDLAIEEIHHRHKKDAPSGTALLIQKQIQEKWGRKIETPLAIRGGGDFGTHTVRLMGSAETLTFQHQALSRSVFADGALTVLQWLIKQRPGFYQFDDFFANQ